MRIGRWHTWGKMKRSNSQTKPQQLRWFRFKNWESVVGTEINYSIGNFGHCFFTPFPDWKWCNKVASEESEYSRTPLRFCLVIFTKLHILAVEKFDLILSRNHRTANYFLNTAEIRVSKNWQKGPLSKIMSLKKREIQSSNSVTHWIGEK